MATQDGQAYNWSSGAKRTRLERRQRRIWSDEQIDSIARWIGLQPGMTIVDVGCGLGYLGYTYAPYVADNGRYIGVDLFPALLSDARAQWTGETEAMFAAGRAEALPLADNFADVVMCQTLLMHLPDPEAALEEMLRVLRPGGTIVCFEPDNYRCALVPPYTSVPETDIDAQVLLFRANLMAHRGRLKLGRGDDGIGPRLPGLFRRLGVRQVEARIRDSVAMLLPPYESEQEQRMLASLRKAAQGDGVREELDAEYREQFLAGGGDPEELKKLGEYMEQRGKQWEAQIDEGTFESCGADLIYAVKGRK